MLRWLTITVFPRFLSHNLSCHRTKRAKQNDCDQHQCEKFLYQSFFIFKRNKDFGREEFVE